MMRRLLDVTDAENRLTVVRNIGPLSATCDTTLAITCGGDADWFAQTDEYNNDGDAAQSKDIGDNEETWIEMTVEGAGNVTFDYKLSAAMGDEFTFTVDGNFRFGRNGSIGWSTVSNKAVTGSGTHTLRCGSTLSVANNLLFCVFSLTSSIIIISLPSSLINGKEVSHAFWHRGPSAHATLSI